MVYGDYFDTVKHVANQKQTPMETPFPMAEVYPQYSSRGTTKSQALLQPPNPH